MQELKPKLDAYRYSVPEDRNWPKDEARLSTRLDRISKSLAVAGVECTTHVDRRSKGGSQKDVVLQWRKPEETQAQAPIENVVFLRRRYI